MEAGSVKLGGERERLAALQRYNLLDAPPEATFDRITRLARAVLDMPIAGLCLVGEHRRPVKFVKEWVRIDAPDGHAFCNHAIERTEPLVVTDAAADCVFCHHPMVCGEPFVRSYVGAPLRSADGHNIGVLYGMDTRPRTPGAEAVRLLQDLARLVMDEMELRLLATTDALTGAMARRAFREALARDVARASRYGSDLGFIMVDIDHFKRVNDSYGHGAGDAVLQGFVAACRTRMRASDYIGRLGGEEFGVVLTETAGDAAMAVAERLRASIAAERLIAAAPTVPVTVSLGVAWGSGTRLNADELVACADRALYAAKAGGRNRSVAFNDIETISRVA